MKIIIFDIDWVIIDSAWKKREIKEQIYKKYWLYDLPWVREIMWLWVNRKVWLDMIYQIKAFDKDLVYNEICIENDKLENNPVWNENILNFIKSNSEKYIFCTNTSMSMDWLNRVFDALDLKKYFRDFLAFDTGTKVENINFVLDKYGVLPSEILFIDDNLNHINNVSKTWVNTFHLVDKNVDLDLLLEGFIM